MSILQIIIISFMAAFLTQAIKLAADGIKGNFTWEHLLSDYGGMPSSHAALVAALSTAVGLNAGWNSPSFAICIILAFIIIRDAIGFRHYLGNYGKVLNLLNKKISSDSKEQIPKVSERIGHTPLETFVGIIIGILIALIAYWIL